MKHIDLSFLKHLIVCFLLSLLEIKAYNYSMVISQSGKAVSWSSFETNSE